MRACLLACALCFAVPPHGALAQAPAAASEADLLLLELRLDRHVLGGGLGAYQAGRHVLLPLGELARLLTLAIRTDPARGQASGFVLDEQRSFHLDVAQAMVTLDGRQRWFASDLVQVRDDDIYVASGLLARWLPIDIEVDFSAQALNVRAREPLPLQRRLERERRGERAGPAARDADPGYVRTEVPYRLWDMPAIDLTLGVDASHTAGRTRGSGHFAAFLTGDLLGLQSTAYLAGTTQRPTGGGTAPQNFRITLGRDDPDAGLLGPLRARSFAFGSVTVPALAHVARTSALGNGITLSNAPLTQSLSFGRHSLRGDLPPGWDVELYVNEALVGHQQSRADGRYAFDDVPLIYGPNEFRLVFHGPQGETRVERQTLLLDQSMLQPGQFHYRLAAHEDGRNDRRAIAQFDWGLTRQISLTAGLTSLPLAGTPQQYANLGLRAQWQSFFVTGDVVRSGSGSLAELAVHGRLAGLRVGISRLGLTKDYVSEEFLPAADGIKFRDRVRLDGVVPIHRALNLPVTLEAKRDELRSGASNVETALRVSGSWHGVFLTQQLRFQDHDGVRSTNGATQLSSRIAALGVRGGIGYDLSGDRRVTEGSLAVDHRLAQGLLLTGSVAHSLDAAETRYSLGFTKGIGAYGLRVAAGRSSRGDTSLGVQLLVAMAREPREGTWRFDALPMADSGGVSARVFLDRNLNGIEDEGDQPLPGVGFTVDGGRHPARTNARGTAHLHRLPTRQHVNVALDTASLEDPQWASRPKGVRLVPRPGKSHSLDFPVIVTGEIDGTVVVVDGAHKRGIGGIELELVDAQRRVVARTTTASDGFYIVEAVPPGTYQLRIQRPQLRPLGLIDTGTRIVTMSAEGDFVNAVDMDVIADWGRTASRAAR
jgi:hypothetical protein